MPAFFAWALVGVLIVIAGVYVWRAVSAPVSKAPQAAAPRPERVEPAAPAPRPAPALKERVLFAIVESAPEALICVDRVGRVILTNAAARKLTGFSREEALGCGERRVQGGYRGSHEPAEDIVARALNDGEPCAFARYTALVSRGGLEYPIAATATAMRADDGGVIGAVLSFDDMTEGRRVRLESRRFAMMIEQAAQGIAATDLAGVITFVNPTMATMHGYRPEEMIGNHLRMLHAPNQVSSQEAFQPGPAERLSHR